MFEQWIAAFSPPPHRQVHPPVPVEVDLSEAIARRSVRPANELPLRVRAEGLDLDRTAAGMLHAWARTSQGAWYGLVEMDLTTANGQGHLPVSQWCPAESIRRMEVAE